MTPFEQALEVFKKIEVLDSERETLKKEMDSCLREHIRQGGQRSGESKTAHPDKRPYFCIKQKGGNMFICWFEVPAGSWLKKENRKPKSEESNK